MCYRTLLSDFKDENAEAQPDSLSHLPKVTQLEKSQNKDLKSGSLTQKPMSLTITPIMINSNDCCSSDFPLLGGVKQHNP